MTSIMKVSQDVRIRQGKLPPVLHIQADNSGRENKNIYVLELCATLVVLGFFKKIQLYFLTPKGPRQPKWLFAFLGRPL
jgi:hypothetical protein